MTELPGYEIVTVTEQVYQILRDKIERQKIPSGTRLIDNELAANFGVSRTPVRDAINRLATEGMVTIVPRRGVFVTRLSPKAIKDLYEVREVLETLAVQLAIPQITDKDLDEMRQLLVEYEETLKNGDYAHHFELDQRFHETLIRLSGNDKLLEINKLLDGSVQITRWMHCETGQISEMALHDHEQILDALAERNTELAVERLRAHICRVKDNLLERQE